MYVCIYIYIHRISLHIQFCTSGDALIHHCLPPTWPPCNGRWAVSLRPNCGKFKASLGPKSTPECLDQNTYASAWDTQICLTVDQRNRMDPKGMLPLCPMLIFWRLWHWNREPWRVKGALLFALNLAEWLRGRAISRRCTRLHHSLCHAHPMISPSCSGSAGSGDGEGNSGGLEGQKIQKWKQMEAAAKARSRQLLNHSSPHLVPRCAQYWSDCTPRSNYHIESRSSTLPPVEKHEAVSSFSSKSESPATLQSSVWWVALGTRQLVQCLTSLRLKIFEPKIG